MVRTNTSREADPAARELGKVRLVGPDGEKHSLLQIRQEGAAALAADRHYDPQVGAPELVILRRGLRALGLDLRTCGFLQEKMSPPLPRVLAFAATQQEFGVLLRQREIKIGGDR